MTMSEFMKKRFNELAKTTLEENGIILEQHLDYNLIRALNGAGYAPYYLLKCWNESEMINEADVSIYCRLLGFDSELGTDASEQLFRCVSITSRWDLIKV